MRKKRVLILSEGFGAGHTQAAEALSESLKRHAPHVQTRVLELGSFLHPTVAPWIFTAYRKTVMSGPRLYGFMYRYQYKKSLNRFTQLAIHRLFYAQTAAVIRQLRPDTIVCTHPFPNVVVSRLKRFGLSVPLVTVITDYDAHGTWVSREVNKYLVSTLDVKKKLQSHGVSPDLIEVTGIPVRPGFWESHDKDELRRSFGLQAMPTVLVMGGGWGLMNTNGFTRHMAGWRDHVQMIFCLGNNEKALADLSENPLFRHPNIRLFGFTKEIDKLMEVSDLLITKPGGMTCTEGLAKGIPMLFYKPIPGQEEENLQYFTEHGFGELIQSTATIDAWFHDLLEQYPEVQKRRSLHTDLVKPSQGIDCSQAVMQLL
ncbi:MGDG synthase family glycosyltransferase [Paenibacillus thalictri]|uniref:UDP-N-acetylglucosamine--LPS N-acetylglucosamine transferase n=1 Tax=Paenibacillus thalictri TaxID=2527873 RepID=A0A4Q9DGA3_9BACL|nr:UDP-N-acetylglucosamine--LPS N-acetylglucosamine transferase [Paenibacillus thalictri]